MNCQECENLMDEFFHHQLSSKQKKQIAEHIKSCSRCQIAYQEFENMLESLRRLEIQPCPDDVVENVFQILNLDKETAHRISILEQFGEFVDRYRWKVGLLGATVVIIFCVIFIYPRNSQHPPVTQQYSEAEIEQAKDQVKLAFAYFNEITSRTQKILEQQVLPQQVIKPMKSSIKKAIKPLLNGGES